jgi:uncharacterized membrane protein
MSEPTSGQFAIVPPRTVDEASLRQMAMIAYGMLLAACVIGVTAIIAVIIAYIKRGDASGTVWQSHYRNVIVVFWVMFAAFAAGLMSFPIALGLFVAQDFAWSWLPAFSVPVLFWLLVFPILLIWFLYRTIRGLVRASESRAY